jgi:hypothetical protein
MSRSLLSLILLSAACATDPDPTAELEVAATSQGLNAIQITRQQLAGDVYHYGFLLRVGDGPNAKLHLHRVVRERAPGLPRRSEDAILLMHGDFSNFASNFAPALGNPISDAPSLAVWLAQHDVDVWGLDRRWTQAPAGPEADVSDFGEMGIRQELDDIRTALTFVRGVRVVTDGSLERVSLSGFSRGGQLAYLYASDEAVKPSWQRHVKTLVPLDVYASIGPAYVGLHNFYCYTEAAYAEAFADGMVDGPNDFMIDVGNAFLTAPDAPTTNPYYPSEFSNRAVFYDVLGQTFWLFTASPWYHLAGSVIDENGLSAGLRYTAEDDAGHWLAGAVPHQSIREQLETEGILCGDNPPAVDLPLSRIQIPLFLIAAAGGYGDRAIYSTTQVASTEVQVLNVRVRAPGEELEDFGHADLLFSPQAAALAWQPLLSWLQAH